MESTTVTLISEATEAHACDICKTMVPPDRVHTMSDCTRIYETMRDARPYPDEQTVRAIIVKGKARGLLLCPDRDLNTYVLEGKDPSEWHPVFDDRGKLVGYDGPDGREIAVMI